MPRFFITIESPLPDHVILEGTDVHHIRNVLRLGPGDTVTLVTPRGDEYSAAIREAGPRAVDAEVLEKTRSAENSVGLEIALAQGVPRGGKMDFVIQKAVELGAASIHPFISSRTVPRLDKARGEKRVARWRRIAMESCKQCGRGGVPAVSEILPLEDVVRRVGPEYRKIVLWEKAPTAWDKVFEDNPLPRRFFVLAGPEGGLSEGEVDVCESAGFIPAGLGPRILRTETTALCFLSILQYQLGDIGDPRR